MTEVISNERLDELLAASPAERVTKEYMESRIVCTSFHAIENQHSPVKVAPTATICNILLDNGYSVRGESACVNPENYNQEIGEKIAYDNAFRQLWPLFGFLLAEKNKLKNPPQTIVVPGEQAA